MQQGGVCAAIVILRWSTLRGQRRGILPRPCTHCFSPTSSFTVSYSNNTFACSGTAAVVVGEHSATQTNRRNVMVVSKHELGGMLAKVHALNDSRQNTQMCALVGKCTEGFHCETRMQRRSDAMACRPCANHHHRMPLPAPFCHCHSPQAFECAAQALGQGVHSAYTAVMLAHTHSSTQPKNIVC